MSSYFEIRDRLVAKYAMSLPMKDGTSAEIAAQLFEAAKHTKQIRFEKAFVISPPDSDKMYFTGRVKAESWNTPINRAFSYVAGRYVQAETANQNGAFWAAEDLHFGAPSVAYGPVNLLHDERAIIGTISEANLHVEDEKYGTHITTCNVLWKYLYPQAVQAVEQASTDGALWQSMECVAEKVKCMGCEADFDYQPWMRNKATGCEHLAKGGARRLVNPTFLATGLILGGAKPAWADADVEVRKQTAAYVEEHEMTEDYASNLVSQILHWANGA